MVKLEFNNVISVSKKYVVECHSNGIETFYFYS